MHNEITIVGSGAAGVAAALGFVDRGFVPTIVDVGVDAPHDSQARGNFYEQLQERDLFDVMIGAEFERVRTKSRRAYPLPAKLAAPRLRFVTQHAEQYRPLSQRDFAPVRSFARGGLANAWGGGLYRAADRDMAGYPIRACDLQKHYDRLTAEIGISGADDDLAAFFGAVNGLQPPLRMSKKAESLLAAYQRRRSRLNAAGVFLGRPRLAVLSERLRDRAACDYTNLEFWEPNLPFIYTPRWTLNRLVDQDLVSYRKGLLVESWSRENGKIIIHARDVAGGSLCSFSSDILVLAAGAIESARLALASQRDCRTKLTLLDNSAVQFPLILPWYLGSALETHCFGLTQLNLVYQADAYAPPRQASILEITSPAKAEFFASLPLASADNLRLIRHLVPAMLVMQLFFPAARERAASLSLADEGTLRIEGAPPLVDRETCKRLAKIMWQMGALTHNSLLVVPTPGQQGIHYAGTLPMSEKAGGKYSCDKFCQLQDEPGVYVVDGSVFPRLPAKNSSFMMMANAMRVAEHVAGKVRSPA
jgi:choline dehydrogenase-like flavoprotein